MNIFNKEQIELHPCGKNFLKKRKDDNLEIVISRYDTYMEKTKPVLDFYLNDDGFHEINLNSELLLIKSMKFLMFKTLTLKESYYIKG